ncbi:hypothetical protein RJ641_020071 [Dillenia turbinata]|uniref:Uncharacterized protein n=1 Tax=Dillenia turbinata TaxID=194707 RepID=A0AAN8YTS9_9MAGN
MRVVEVRIILLSSLACPSDQSTKNALNGVEEATLGGTPSLQSFQFGHGDNTTRRNKIPRMLQLANANWDPINRTSTNVKLPSIAFFWKPDSSLEACPLPFTYPCGMYVNNAGEDPICFRIITSTYLQITGPIEKNHFPYSTSPSDQTKLVREPAAQIYALVLKSRICYLCLGNYCSLCKPCLWPEKARLHIQKYSIDSNYEEVS